MKTIYIISRIISFFFSAFALVFIVFLPLTGIYFDYDTHGSSMEPALTNEVTIRLSPERVPFEDLQVGDIILFRQKDYQKNNMPPGVVYTPEWNEDHTRLQLIHETELEEESQEYINIQHRIIEINEKGLVTKGDNNEFQDFLTVKPEEYQGKIVWHINHINWLFKAMYQYGLWLGCTILFLLCPSFRGKRKIPVCLQKTQNMTQMFIKAARNEKPKTVYGDYCNAEHPTYMLCFQNDQNGVKLYIQTF